MKTEHGRQVASIATLLITAWLAAIVLAAPTTIQAVPISSWEQLSVGSDGASGNESSFFVYLSGDGRYAVFESWATNWADPSLANSRTDIFWRDRVTGQTRQVSRSYLGHPTNEDSYDPVLSADGRYVAFFSYASNLVPGDTNDEEWIRTGLDVFVYDAAIDRVERVSLNAHGEQIDGNSVGTITPDGRVILLISSGTNVLPDDPIPGGTAIYWREWQTGHMERITYGIDGGLPNGGFVHMWGSYDGSRIVFSSPAGNLVPNDHNGELDVFLYDRATRQTRRISVAADGQEGNARSGQPVISPDGKFVVFRSHASNLVPGDTNGEPDIFLYDVAENSLRRINVSDGGEEANGLSGDPGVCGDGRLLSFTSEASNLVPSDTNNERDVFLVNRDTGEIQLVSRGIDGLPSDGRAHRSAIAADCRTIAFASDANNLVAGSANDVRDIFAAGIELPARLRGMITARGTVASGGELPVTVTLVNEDLIPLQLGASYSVPESAEYVPGSASGGAEYAGGVLTWQGELAAGSSRSFSFVLRVAPEPTTPYPLRHTVAVSGDAEATLSGVTIVNGLDVFLPVTAAQP